MVWVKSVHLNDLKQRIQVMLYSLTSLMEFGTVSNEFMALNATTINWVKDIEPILDYNSSMYEALKFEYEGKLQKTVAYVNQSVEELLPLLTILNDMDDFSRYVL